jgi:hypothetical protein
MDARVLPAWLASMKRPLVPVSAPGASTVWLAHSSIASRRLSIWTPAREELLTLLPGRVWLR